MKANFRPLFAALAISISAAACASPDLADIAIIDRSTGERLRTYAANGQLWVAGKPGDRYAIVLSNRSGERLLSVVSVDGVNVVSGETAARDQRGYVLAPGGTTQIEGWRKSEQEVAAFVFTALPDSYAARTQRPQNVGVIGIATFREYREPVQLQEPAVSNRAPEARRSDGKLAADAAAPAAAPVESRLGTGHGERVTSPVQLVDFRRMQASPDQVLTIRYDSRQNLVAMGIIPPDHGWRRQPIPRAFPGDGYVPDPS